MLENPSDRGDRDSPAWWARYADHAPLWLQPSIQEAAAQTGARPRTFAQCAFGAPWQKWTTILHSVGMDPFLAALDTHGCDHGRVPHAAVAHGRDEAGRARAEEAAAYPPRLNTFLAEVLRAGARLRLEAEPRGSGEGRLIGDGISLAGRVRELCEVARHVPVRFASARNLRPAPLHSVRR